MRKKQPPASSGRLRITICLLFEESRELARESSLLLLDGGLSILGSLLGFLSGLLGSLLSSYLRWNDGLGCCLGRSCCVGGELSSLPGRKRRLACSCLCRSGCGCSGLCCFCFCGGLCCCSGFRCLLCGLCFCCLCGCGGFRCSLLRLLISEIACSFVYFIDLLLLDSSPYYISCRKQKYYSPNLKIFFCKKITRISVLFFFL